MRSILSRRALIAGSLITAIGTGSAGMAAQAQAAPHKPVLSPKVARAEVYKQVKRMSDPTRHEQDRNGFVGNYGVVKAQDCEQTAINKVECAWGMFWPNGHRAFSRMEITAVKQFGHVVLKHRNVLPLTVDDEDLDNGGAPGLGTATNIDPSGTGPLSQGNGDDDGDDLAALGIGADEPVGDLG